MNIGATVVPAIMGEVCTFLQGDKGDVALLAILGVQALPSCAVAFASASGLLASQGTRSSIHETELLVHDVDMSGLSDELPRDQRTDIGGQSTRDHGSTETSCQKDRSRSGNEPTLLLLLTHVNEDAMCLSTRRCGLIGMSPRRRRTLHRRGLLKLALNSGTTGGARKMLKKPLKPPQRHQS